MWQNINQRLDTDHQTEQRHKLLVSYGAQWRPAFVLAVAAGFFWFALIPALPNMDAGFPAQSSKPPIVVPAGTPDPENSPAKMGRTGRREVPGYDVALATKPPTVDRPYGPYTPQ
jgi:hypothetical protein